MGENSFSRPPVDSTGPFAVPAMKPSAPKPAAQASTEDVLRPFEDRKWVDVGFSGDVQQRPDGLLGRRVFVLRQERDPGLRAVRLRELGRVELGHLAGFVAAAQRDFRKATRFATSTLVGARGKI